MAIELGTGRAWGHPEEISPQSDVVAELRAEAAGLEALVRTDLGRAFLRATSQLPKVAARTVYRHKETRLYLSARAVETLPPEPRDKYEAKPLSERDYYYTKYGTPLAYVRPLEILGERGMSSAKGLRILDYGYGTVGPLRLLATLGADVVGVDVDSYLPALYCESMDQGVVASIEGSHGRVTMVDGHFPGDDAVRKAVGQDFDLILSKNTLKNGYIHPAEPVDERKLVKLGVSDAAFVSALFQSLRPGGRVLIYNICPAPAKPGQPYIPWADGRCPFSRELWESSGFRVLEFDKEDSKAVREMGRSLGWDKGEGAMNLETDLFGLYTLVQRPN